MIKKTNKSLQSDVYYSHEDNYFSYSTRKRDFPISLFLDEICFKQLVIELKGGFRKKL